MFRSRGHRRQRSNSPVNADARDSGALQGSSSARRLLGTLTVRFPNPESLLWAQTGYAPKALRLVSTPIRQP